LEGNPEPGREVEVMAGNGLKLANSVEDFFDCRVEVEGYLFEDCCESTGRNGAS
jgi:hypothetical protein